MEMPGGVSTLLARFQECQDDVELYQKLSANTEVLVQFLSTALLDITWSEHHVEFYRLAFLELTDRYMHRRIEERLVNTLSQLLQRYYRAYEAYLPKSMTFISPDGRIEASPLFIGCASRYIRERLYREGATIAVQEPLPLVAFALHYLQTGEAAEFVHGEPEQIEALLCFAERWEIHSLKALCEHALLPYVEDKPLEVLIAGLRHKRFMLVEHALKIFSRPQEGLFVRLKGEGVELSAKSWSLPFEERVESLTPYIQGIVVSGLLFREASFLSFLSRCSLITHMDCSQSDLPPPLERLPQRLDSWIFDHCSWCDDRFLQQFVQYFPHTKRLSLACNSHITYLGWAALRECAELEELQLAHCRQLNDIELRLLTQVLPRLRTIGLEGCLGISAEAKKLLSFLHIQMDLGR